MHAAQPDTDAVRRVRSAILAFLGKRAEPKLKALVADLEAKALDHEQYEADRLKIQDQFSIEGWMAYVAATLPRVQQVTHPIKLTHPQISGASSFMARKDLALAVDRHAEVCTHDCGEGMPLDAAADAAALPAYAFATLVVDGRSVFDRANDGDSVLAAALTDDKNQASHWLGVIAQLQEPKGRLASHKLAKQIYWPLGDGRYHVLAPLSSSTLIHVVRERVRDALFSEEAALARKARRENEPHHASIREYPRYATRTVGGSKPQNVSTLNNARSGEVILLRSTPPIWTSRVRLPYGTDSVFHRFFPARPDTRDLTTKLRDLLDSASGKRANARIRAARDRLLAGIIDELLRMAGQLQSKPAGWSEDERCTLDIAEARWLDPGRAARDADFAAAADAAQWRSVICRRFASWINDELEPEGADAAEREFGFDEAAYWRRALEREMALLKEVIDHD